MLPRPRGGAAGGVATVTAIARGARRGEGWRSGKALVFHPGDMDGDGEPDQGHGEPERSVRVGIWGNAIMLREVEGG